MGNGLSSEIYVTSLIDVLLVMPIIFMEGWLVSQQCCVLRKRGLLCMLPSMIDGSI
jgi:hypothetical protein